MAQSVAGEGGVAGEMSDALNVLRPHDANVLTGDVRKYLVELDVLLGMPISEGCAIP